MKGQLILTAAGFYNTKVLDYVTSAFPSKSGIKVAIVTTASKEKELNKYSLLAKSQFMASGFEIIDFVDLEEDPNFSFAPYHVIYVCGGNTFKLMKFAREAHFADSVRTLLENDGVYIGVSAGSVIAGPSIQIAVELSPDINEVGLTNMDGLGLTNVVVYPHYEESEEDRTCDFEAKYNVVVTRLANNQALLISNNERKLIN